MKLSNLDDTKLGWYACYVHASTGTLRHQVELVKSIDNNEIDVHVPKPTRKISLVVEKLKPNLMGSRSNELVVFGETYEFDCVSGLDFFVVDFT